LTKNFIVQSALGKIGANLGFCVVNLDFACGVLNDGGWLVGCFSDGQALCRKVLQIVPVQCVRLCEQDFILKYFY
jgi:hypothetical protein